MTALSPRFTCIPLGAGGGLCEGNLSSYLVTVRGSSDFVCLDAGTLKDGLSAAVAAGCFADLPRRDDDPLTLEGQVLQRHVKAYLISHGYLDHVEGLVEASPTDSAKPILGLPGVLADLEQHLFNWRLWPNFCDRGVEPCLGLYRYQPLTAGVPEAIPATPFTVEAHPLAHGPFTDSTAFLLEANGHYLLYLGDTGPDSVEGRPTTRCLWERIAPLIRADRLHGLFIESSYADGRPDDQLYSHLTPRWVMQGLRELAALVDNSAPRQALAGLNIVITHVKPNFAAGPSQAERVRAELTAQNDLGVTLRFAEQAVRFEL